MVKTLKIATVQLNPTIGDLVGNMEKVRAAYEQAKSVESDIVVLPECIVIGYPAEDLLLKPSAVRECMARTRSFVAHTKDGPAVVFSSPWYGDGEHGKSGLLYSAVLFMQGGEITDIRLKHNLPNYGVFDEKRVFNSGPLPTPIVYKGVKIGVPICEDIWHEGVCEHLAAQGAEILISPNGSPWRRNAHWQRETVARARIENTGLPMIYVNQLGGQDELAFDGSSFSMNGMGEYVQTLASFEEDFDLATWEKQNGVWTCKQAKQEPQLKGYEADWRAMAMGLGDYIHKNGFSQVVLGMSGGIDSAMAACIAADTLGPENVWCVMLPSKYTSSDSLEDAKSCAKALGCRYDIIQIGDAVGAFTGMLAPRLKGLKATPQRKIYSPEFGPSP